MDLGPFGRLVPRTLLRNSRAEFRGGQGFPGESCEAYLEDHGT